MGDILAPRKTRGTASSTGRRKEGEAHPHPINLAKLESLILALEIARVRADRRTTTPIMAEKYGAVWRSQLVRRNCKDHKEDAPQNTLNGTSFERRRPVQATNLTLNGGHEALLEITEADQATT